MRQSFRRIPATAQGEWSMGVSQANLDKVTIRLAKTQREVEAAQHLRYKVFYEEFGAIPSPQMQAMRRDFDEYDDIADHLIVVDQSIADMDRKIVGTYRLVRQEAARQLGHFYTSGEYDISAITARDESLLELGRSCVLAEYRTRPVLQLLWQGITNYMLEYNVGLMFGCASLHGTDPASLAIPLSYLYHYHMAPPDMRPRAHQSIYLDMNMIPKDQIDAKAAFNMLPPLVKGYLRLGACVGDGAVIDRQFNTIDVCIILPMAQVASRYHRHYVRKAMAGAGDTGHGAVAARESADLTLV